MPNFPKFQSPPASRGGCNATGARWRPVTATSFNPHPPLGAGATRMDRMRQLNRRGFNPHPPLGAGATQSPHGRPTQCRGFNPHPPLGAGATLRLRRQHYRAAACFNPHPPLGAGATFSYGAAFASCRVSIPTRLSGRVQRRKTCAILDIARLVSRRQHDSLGLAVARNLVQLGILRVRRARTSQGFWHHTRFAHEPRLDDERLA